MTNKKETWTVLLPLELKNEVKTIAAKRGITHYDLLSSVLQEWLKTNA